MKKYNKDNLEKIVKCSLSIAEVCRKLNMRPVGGNYKTLKKHFRINKIDTSHFTGKGWNVGENYIHYGKKFTLPEILIKNSTYTSTVRLKIRLIESGLKQNKCEKCGLIDWNGQKISLHLDHKNGDNLDNRIENLRILCPNCHSQTKTYCNSKIKSSSSELRKKNYENRINKSDTKNIKIKPKILKYCECGKQIKNNSKTCVNCYAIKQRKVKDRPDKQILLQMVKETSFEAVGRKYGVSSNAVRKWIKKAK